MSKPRSIPTDTNLITELDVATAALLAKREGILELRGIKSLTPDVARELGRIQGDGIFLRGLTSLSAEVAEELLPIAQKLGIGGPEFDEEQDDFSVAHLFGDELAPSVARLLVDRCAGGGLAHYTIPEHTCIGSEAAALLASIENDDVTLTLRSIKKLDADLSSSLSRCRALLRLPNLEQITEMQARQLACGNVSLEVAAKTDMSTAAVRELVQSRGRIEFTAPNMLQRHAPALAEAQCVLDIGGDDCISEYAAQHLARATCSGIFLRVGAIDDQAALALARSAAGALTLYCQDLTDEAAAALARFPGIISLPYLTQLRATPGYVALAARFAQQRTGESYSCISLIAIKTLSREAANALVGTRAPELHLGIEDLPSAVAIELARYSGRLTMRNLSHVSVDVADSLAHGKNKSLFIGLKSMSCDVAYKFASHSLSSLTLSMPAQAAAVDVIRVLGSSGPLALWLSGDSMASPVLDAVSASPQLSAHCRFDVVTDLQGWPHALPRALYARYIESVNVVGEYPGLTKISGIGFTPRVPKLKSLTIDRCPTIQELDFRGPADVAPVQESSLRIRLTQCAQLERLTIMTERFCASHLELSALPKCQQVVLSIPDLPDLSVLSDIDSIERLALYRSPGLKSLEGIQRLRHLTDLEIVSCPQIVHLSQLESMRELETLVIGDCPGIASVEVAANLPKLCSLTFRGKTGVVSLHCLRDRDDLSVKIEGASIGVPPSLIKYAYNDYGAGCLAAFSNALVECQHCGGQQFQGTCHGWYGQIEYSVAERVAKLDGSDYLSSAESLFVSLESDLQSAGLEDAIEDSAYKQFPVLHAAVTCVTCTSVFDPASFGAKTGSYMGGNWSEVGEVRSDGTSIRQMNDMVVDFSVEPRGANRPSPEDGKCPICCRAPLELSISRRAQRETAGKFSGHVAIDRVAWSELPDCFHLDEGNEKADDIWEWSRTPLGSWDMDISCENACFWAPVEEPEQVLHVLLASLALFEAEQEQPDLDLVAMWIRALANSLGQHKGLAEGAVARIDMISPDCVDSPSGSGDPQQVAVELRQKAKAVLEQALPLAKK